LWAEWVRSSPSRIGTICHLGVQRHKRRQRKGGFPSLPPSPHPFSFGDVCALFDHFLPSIFSASSFWIPIRWTMDLLNSALYFLSCFLRQPQLHLPTLCLFFDLFTHCYRWDLECFPRVTSLVLEVAEPLRRGAWWEVLRSLEVHPPLPLFYFHFRVTR
jgi:hypothetical protein